MKSLLARRVLGLAAAAVLGFALVGAVPAQAQDAGGFIDGVARQVLDKLKSGVSDSEREATLRSVLRANFDLPSMGRAALGPYWARTTPAQQTRYLAAIESAEVRAYSDRLRQYGGQSLKVVRQSPGPGGATMVDSQIVQPSGGAPVRLVWEVQNRGGKFLVTDVSIEGVSMVLTRRSDFNAYISRNGGDVEALIAELERRAGK